MNDRLSLNHLYPTRIPPAGVGNTKPSQSDTPRSNEASPSFKDVLSGQLVRFSHHAEQRLKQRGIEFKPDQIAKLDSAINQVAKKGAKDSLILMQDVALIVNVKQKTVVTAMDGPSMKDNVFTQIDSAVIVS